MDGWMDVCTLKGKGDHFYSEWSYQLNIRFHVCPVLQLGRLEQFESSSLLKETRATSSPIRESNQNLLDHRLELLLPLQEFLNDSYIVEINLALLTLLPAVRTHSFCYLAEYRNWVCKRLGDARRSRDHAPSICCSRMLMHRARRDI